MLLALHSGSMSFQLLRCKGRVDQNTGRLASYGFVSFRSQRDAKGLSITRIGGGLEVDKFAPISAPKGCWSGR